MKHGTFAGYEQHGCRCDRCRGFLRDYRRKQRGTLRRVFTYETGEPVERIEYVPRRKFRLELTEKGREYLHSLKEVERVA